MDDRSTPEDDVLTSEMEHRFLAEAREALADAREVLLEERERTADAREARLAERERRADEGPPARAHSGHEAQLDHEIHVELKRHADRLAGLIDAADARDRAAEIRDRAAEARQVAAALRAARHQRSDRLDERDRAQADVDRYWSGADRDASAGDRAELRDLVRRDLRGDEG